MVSMSGNRMGCATREGPSATWRPNVEPCGFVTMVGMLRITVEVQAFYPCTAKPQSRPRRVSVPHKMNFEGPLALNKPHNVEFRSPRCWPAQDDFNRMPWQDVQRKAGKPEPLPSVLLSVAKLDSFVLRFQGTQRLHVALWHRHRPQSYDLVNPLRPMHLP